MNKRNTKSNPEEDYLNHFKDLLVYLGQLEFNIINATESLKGMQLEKEKTIESLRELEQALQEQKK